MTLQFPMLLTALVTLLAACNSPAATPAVQVASSSTTRSPSPTAAGIATALPQPTQPAVDATATDNPSPTETRAGETPAPAEAGEIATTEPVNWLEVEGKTDDGFTYLGNPDALVTLIDYSDYL